VSLTELKVRVGHYQGQSKSEFRWGAIKSQDDRIA
jgi:hypothetical protein